MFIQMNNARKSYGKGESTVHALDGIELALEQGKIYVILGPSGSGKSTLLNMMGGLDRLDEGSITVDGKEISRLKSGELTKYRKTDVGFVFQFYNLLPDLTVKENIQVVEDIAKDPLPIDEVMKAVDIEKYKDRFPNELSGGQQQRTSIGRAIIKNPDILLCDEPTGALDYNTSKDILKLIEDVNKKYGNTIIIVTHNDAIKNMADRVITLRDGRIRKNYVNDNKITAADLEW